MKQKYSDLLSEHFIKLWNMESEEYAAIRWEDARTFFTPARIDLASKLAYIDHYLNDNNPYAVQLYYEHLYAFSRGTFDEPGDRNKNTFEDYIKSFNLLIEDIKEHGFREKGSAIPVGMNGVILNGSHRTAVAIYFNLKIPVFNIANVQKEYDYSFFLKRGMSQDSLKYLSLCYKKWGGQKQEELPLDELQILKAYDTFKDQESIDVFWIRLNYLFDGNVELLSQKCMELYKNKFWRIKDLDKKIREVNCSRICIWGVNSESIHLYQMLIRCNYDVACIIDIEDITREEIFDENNFVKIIGFNHIKDYLDNYIVIETDKEPVLGTEKYISQKNLWRPRYGKVVATWGKQYFDLWSCEENEVFIDAGVLDGNTIVQFLEWSGGSYKNVFGLEPVKEQYELAVEHLKEYPNIQLFNVAAWSENTTLLFSEAGSGSMVCEDGMIEVPALTIDSIVKNERVTFIKMDIEGSELAALQGATKTIKKWKPRLAICIYHKAKDVLEIMEYLYSLVPDYVFTLRHYTSYKWETVLYAELDKTVSGVIY